MSDIKNKPVVVDTNVIISGLFGPASSYPSMIVGAWRAHRFCVAISHELLDELSRVFQKPRFIKLLEPHAIATAALDVMIKKSILISPQKLTKVYFSDPTDHFLLELAVSAKAPYIITGDKKLLLHKKVCGVQLISPKEFCQTLKSIIGAAAIS